MKILPTGHLLEKLVRRYSKAVLLIGTRKSESVQRRKNMAKRNVSGASMNPHHAIKNCLVFAPLAELDDDDVWVTLMQRPPPWGGTHRNLITLYRNAGGGECPLVLTKEDVPSCGTSSPRFGCWTCTVVAKDRSLRGLIESDHKDAAALEELFDFREWLVDLREENTNRQHVRRNGSSKIRPDGSKVLGPFTLKVRKEIYRELKQLELRTGWTLISPSEIEVIEDIWRRDQILEDCRNALAQTLDTSKESIRAHSVLSTDRS